MSKAATSLRNCSFCGKHITTGHGMMLVRNDGQIQWTCSSKCKKNLRVLRRDPRKLVDGPVCKGWPAREKAVDENGSRADPYRGKAGRIQTPSDRQDFSKI